MPLDAVRGGNGDRALSASDRDGAATRPLVCRQSRQWKHLGGGRSSPASSRRNRGWQAAGGLHEGNVAAVKDLIQAIEQSRQPLANIYEARKTVEMIAAVFESHRLGRAVDIPLRNRKNPLTSWE